MGLMYEAPGFVKSTLQQALQEIHYSRLLKNPEIAF
jgi:hypothetical protein